MPDQTTIASFRFHLLHSNVASDEGTVNENNDLDTKLGVFQFVQTLRFGSDQGSIFLVVPASHISENAITDDLSGLGDAQLGFVYGVLGTPALKPADYADHPPGLAANLLAKIFFPTGKYSSQRSVNVGANRWALRLGVPIVYAMGERMADPHLMTIEAMPTVTFYTANDEPFGAGRTRQKPLFIFEGHLTRGFTRSFWASLDLLWREGGEVRVDGVDAGNSQSALSLGTTGTFALPSNLSLRLSAGKVIARNEHGPDGWMLRTIVGTVF
ncbi:MAG TPA: transporter [Sphingomicrobium sp.]